MDSERLRIMLSLISGIEQDNAINELESSLSKTTNDADFPTPNSCHPALSSHADFVRQFNKDFVKIANRPMCENLFEVNPYSYPSSNDVVTTEVLVRKKYFGLAPYVGAPFLYTWSVWFDKYNRYISGEATIQFL